MTEILVAIVSALAGGVVASIITYLVSYPLGIKQGKQQVRHERALTVITELYRGLLTLRKLLRAHVESLPTEDNYEPKEVEQHISELETYFEENELVLDELTRGGFQGIISDTQQQLWDFSFAFVATAPEATEETKRNEHYRAGVKLAMWIEERYSYSLHMFREIAKAEIGTGELPDGGE